MSSRPTAIEALAKDPAASGLVLDFDGVLSPIVEDPTTSAMPDRVAVTLSRLARSMGLLAVMSGRPVKFLADRVPAGIPLLGTYGIERLWNGEYAIEAEARQWLGPVSTACQALMDRLSGSPGVRVEEKSVSVAVHWRQAPDRAAAAHEVREVTAQVAEQTGLLLEPGKLVQELRPPIDVNKGSAISSLLASEKLAMIAYAGDDLGDIPALRAVRKARGYALVVDHGSETDPELRELADQTYAGTEAFAAWLAELAEAIGA